MHSGARGSKWKSCACKHTPWQSRTVKSSRGPWGVTHKQQLRQVVSANPVKSLPVRTSELSSASSVCQRFSKVNVVKEIVLASSCACRSVVPTSIPRDHAMNCPPVQVRGNGSLQKKLSLSISITSTLKYAKIPEVHYIPSCRFFPHF